MSAPAAPHITLGRRGEQLATRYLHRRTNLRVLERNWRHPEGELDIVAINHTNLVICEVKTRTTLTYGTPAEAITDAKALRIRRLTRYFARTYGIHLPHRFDILAILWPTNQLPRVTHIPGAF